MALTLLRQAELRRRVLPAYVDDPEKEEPKDEDAEIKELGKNLSGADEEIIETVKAGRDDSSSSKSSGSKTGKKRHRILSAARSAAKFSVSTMMAVDHVKARVGRSETSKARLGVLANENETRIKTPVKCGARYNGKRGYIFIYSSGDRQHMCCGFVTESMWRNTKETDVEFAFSVNDIVEIKKVGGLGWKTEMLAGWALQRNIRDGLFITTDFGGQKQQYVINAIENRDMIFNRLIAMGSQTWEAW